MRLLVRYLRETDPNSGYVLGNQRTLQRQDARVGGGGCLPCEQTAHGPCGGWGGADTCHPRDRQVFLGAAACGGCSQDPGFISPLPWTAPLHPSCVTVRAPLATPLPCHPARVVTTDNRRHTVQVTHALVRLALIRVALWPHPKTGSQKVERKEDMKWSGQGGMSGTGGTGHAGLTEMAAPGALLPSPRAAPFSHRRAQGSLLEASDARPACLGLPGVDTTVRTSEPLQGAGSPRHSVPMPSLAVRWRMLEAQEPQVYVSFSALV